ncbi:MAG: hydantoinase/oxoprolinase family protein [Chloroflexi bacterium]|nr:hydantoinase/oxoprolinase family protein [Chloroflexota bacterium]
MANRADRCGVGIDVGGTFTDLVLRDEETGELSLEKRPTTPADPSIGTLAGVSALLCTGAAQRDGVAVVRHGTTVATNALLERRGAVVGLLTTAGFQDVLEIGRCKRTDVYDLQWQRTPPLVPRHLRREVDERILADGSVLRPLNVEDLRRQTALLRGAGVTALAIAFVNSYANPAHERAAAELLREIWPEVLVSQSTELSSELGEYERTNLAVVNAFLQPVMAGYLRRLQSGLVEQGVRAPLQIMQSNGGAADVEQAARFPARALLSGPAAGVAGAVQEAQAAGIENIITFDMGGTSCDVSLVRGARAETSGTNRIGQLPLTLPMLDLTTIGAGGGSIASAVAGALKVGPESAGASPGPASYGQGGTRPTVTDAWLLTGLLGDSSRLGGSLRLDRSAAVAAMAGLANALGMSILDAARGVIRVVQANMANAVRAVSTRRGFDPRHFTLVAYGGAGPLAAVEVARQIGVPRVLIPALPGLLCALGALGADLRYELRRSVFIRLDDAAAQMALDRSLREVELACRAQMPTDVEGAEVERMAYLRYRGQPHALGVVLPTETPTPEHLRALFEAEYAREYVRTRPDQPVEVRSISIAVVKAVSWQRRPSSLTGVAPPASERPVDVLGGQIRCPVVQRQAIRQGAVLVGPCLIEQADSTTWLPPRSQARCDALGNLLVEVG